MEELRKVSVPHHFFLFFNISSPICPAPASSSSFPQRAILTYRRHILVHDCESMIASLSPLRKDKKRVECVHIAADAWPDADKWALFPAICSEGIPSFRKLFFSLTSEMVSQLSQDELRGGGPAWTTLWGGSGHFSFLPPPFFISPRDMITLWEEN